MVSDQLEEVDRLLDSLLRADDREFGNAHLIAKISRLQNRTDAVVAKAFSVYEQSGEWHDSGARSAAAHIARTCHLPLGRARSLIRYGKKLKSMPHVSAAFANGEIATDHVGLLCRVHNRATAEVFADDEKRLVDNAKFASFAKFKRSLGYWYADVDPDRSERSFTEMTDRRSFHYSKVLDMFFGDLKLDPVSGEILHNALVQIERELFDADWAEAKARVGDGVAEKDLARTRSQRMADALVELAIRGMSVPANARRPEPLFTVVVGYETFAGPICELLGGAVVPPSLLDKWIDSAWIERIVFDGPSRVIDVGETRRIFTGATRRAIEVRDRECYHPTCEEPIDRCQADHVTPYAAGGPTIIANGRLACGFHNRARNARAGPGP